MPIHRRGSSSYTTATVHRHGASSWSTADRVWAKVDATTWVVASGMVVDNFEDGGAGEWSTQGTGSRSVVSSGLDGTDFRWQHDGFSEVHLTGADAVDRGPQPGDVWEFWYRIESTSGSVINRFEFSADGINESDVYRIEFERETGADEFSIEKISGGSQAKIDTNTNFVPNIGQTYRCVIGWNDNDTDVTAQMFFPDGSTASGQVIISDDSSASGSDFTQPGVFIRTNDNNSCSWDEIKITE